MGHMIDMNTVQSSGSRTTGAFHPATTQPILEKGLERPGAECVRDGRDFFGQKGRIHLMININDTT